MLKGERVVLRGLSRDDLETIWAFNNDLEVELAGGGDPPIPQSLHRLQAEFDQDAAKGGRDGARFVIELDGRVVGHCGLHNINETDRTAELGISIGVRELWDKGHGRDAVRTLTDYGFRHRNMRKVWLRVWANNERGIRSYLSVGFVEEGRQREHVWSAGRFVDLVYMGVMARDWPGLPGQIYV